MLKFYSFYVYLIIWVISDDREAVGEYAVSPFEEELVFEVSKNRARVLNQINKALRETQL